MQTATQSFEKIQQTAEAIRNNQIQRFPEAASPGDCFRQGDLYITRLEAVPAGCKKVKAEAQLAPGTSQGSRHVLDSLKGVRVYAKASPTVLDGPIVELEEERTITHPEHGHVALPAGVYGVTYQRQYAEELRRVAD